MASKTRSFTQSYLIPSVKPEDVYNALLDAKKHSQLTGGECTGDGTPGSTFTAWDGYITGKNVTLEPNKRIIQEWETSEWPEDAAVSTVEWTFAEAAGGTQVTMTHSNVPMEQADSYEKGWIDYYWEPMKEYFAR